jgi:beta-galactosidase
VVDANGIFVPRAEDLIEFSVEGPGRIVNVDSGDNTDLAPFQTTRRRAFNGIVFANVKATANGKLTISAKAQGLLSNKVAVTSVR